MNGRNPMTYLVGHYIKGALIKTGHQKLPLFDPARGEQTGEVLVGDKALLDQAVKAAKEAFPEWRNTSPLKRARILFKFKYLLETHLEELALLVTKEHGKTLSDAKGSVQRGIDVVEFLCGIPHLLTGTFSEEVSRDIDHYSVRQPLGVCAGITPFNFPAMIPLWMFPMAIACGNTFILKPSEKDPSCSIRLAELFKEAGLPDGVLNVVQGDQVIVNALITHPDIQSISFVGSTKVAEMIYQKGTSEGKRVQAFGGAKNHCVVMEDADLDEAANAILGAAYGSAGERCMAISVVVAVGDKVADALIKKMEPRIHALKIGSGLDQTIEMGPLVTESHFKRVESYIELGAKEGAVLCIDGRKIKPKGYEKGFFLGGSLFDHVKPSMRIYQEEIFGPVLCVVRVKTFEEALKLINENCYGNGTAIFTRDGNIARRFAYAVQVGMVGINVPIPVPAPFHGFGGWKQSMFGDIHMHGTEGIRFYTKLKTITQRWEKKSKDIEFSMPSH